MDTLFSSTFCLIMLLMIFLSSCIPSNRAACPAYDSGKVSTIKRNKKAFNYFGMYSSKTKKSKPRTMPYLMRVNRDLPYVSDPAWDPLFEEPGMPYLSVVKENVNESWLPTFSNSNKSNYLTNKKTMPTRSPFGEPQVQEGNKEHSLTKKQDGEPRYNSRRRDAVIKGTSLILMAVLAGVSIPVLGTLTASIGLLAILILDIIVSVAILSYYRIEKPILAYTTAFLRLGYSAVFGIAIGHHILGRVALFTQDWSLGLILFGLHLIALGVLFNNEGGKTVWNYIIKTLLIFAGMGYLILNVGLLVAANPVAFAAFIEPVFIVPQVLGELLFALWMIIKGGKSKSS